MDIEKICAALRVLPTTEELMEAEKTLYALQAENERLRAELERMKKIMRDKGIMTIPPQYPGGPTEWNIPKPRSQKED